ncbi:MAG: hypothetical protein CMD66_08685 [Gammaproteobacteria bacterium]|nr:hypothetical protein [Gammaproteobacteria bacterium]HCL69074.1 hypothetical protein [Gammaproteobacteria bacterium]
MFLCLQVFELQLVRLGITPKALKRGGNMSYIHDLTTTALNLIDARRNLEADGFASANHSKYATFDNLLAIVSRCSSIPRCDTSVLESVWNDRDRVAVRGQVSEEIWYLLSAANEGQIDNGNPALLVDRAISLCIADQPGSA